MKIIKYLLRFLGIVVLFMSLSFGVTAILATFSDGPIQVFAGGPLEQGELVTGPEPNWRFVRDIATIEFQLLNPARSRTVWIIENEGRIYLISGYMNSLVGRIWKQWPAQAMEDGRAIIRIDGKRYARQLVRIERGPILGAIAAEAARKYGVPMTREYIEEGNGWVFALVPRPAS
ncbi:MAG: hypothetical protein RL120_05320 [Gammaproteobacteria bacterium]